MATQVVELTGDEAALLKSYNAAIAKQVEFEKKLSRSGEVGDAAGVQLADAMKRVERESAKALEGMLKDLEKVGPEGREAATELRKHLVAAGKLSENSIDGVLKKLEAFDPESAAAAKSIVANLKQGTEESETLFDKFSDSAVAGLGAVVTAYVGVQQAIQLVNEFIEHQNELVEKSRSAHVSLAQAQQEFFKNSVTFTDSEQQQLLTQDIPQIQAEIGFPSRAALVEAGGAAASSGGTSQTIPELLREAGRITKLKPDDLDEYVIAALSLQKITGDAAKNTLNMLLTAGGVALVKDPRGVQENLPKAVTSAVGTTQGQDPVLAAREAAALFGVATEFGSDVTGQSSATAVSKLATFLRELTAGRGDDPGGLVGRLQLVQSDPALKAQFLDKLPAEAQFQVPFEKLVEPQSREFLALQANVQKITGGSSEFDKTVAQIERGTQSSMIAVAEAASQAALELSQLADGDQGVLGQVRKIFTTAEESQPRSMLETFGRWVESAGEVARRAINDQPTAIEEGVASVAGLERRRQALLAGGLTQAEIPQERSLSVAIDALVALLSDSANRNNIIDARGVPEARRILAETDTGAKVFDRLASILERIEANTQPQPLTSQLSANQP